MNDRRNGNLKRWLLGAAQNEPILAVVIGHGERGDSIPRGERQHGKVLSWEEAAPLLDYPFYAGFGGAGCESAYAWTENLIIGVYEYDGATSVESLPRHPIEGEQTFL